MFGFDPDELGIEPIEINGTVYVPYHAQIGEQQVSTYVSEEKMYELLDEEDDELGTDDFRFDP